MEWIQVVCSRTRLKRWRETHVTHHTRITLLACRDLRYLYSKRLDLRCSHVVLAMVHAWSNTVQVARPSSISIETPQYCSTVRPYLGVDPDLHSNLGVLRSAACGVRDTLVRQRLQPRSPLPFVVLLNSTPYPVFPSQREASGPHIL